MPLTSSDVPELLLPGLKTEFEVAYRSQVDSNLAQRIATVINTTLPAQRYAWLGAVPGMREFVDERRPSGLASHAVTIEDRVFESSLAVDRRAMEDDQLDLIRLRIRELADRVGHHRQQIVVEALTGGDAGAGFDGEPLFSLSHPTVPGSTATNVTTDALSADALRNAISDMMQVPDDAGVPLGIVPDTLLVGPNQMWAAIELVESPVVVAQATTATGTPPTDYLNAFQGRLKVEVSPFISGTDEDKWFLLDTKRPIKGVILQQRSDVPTEFTALDHAGSSESAWMRDRYHYGVRARYNVGYGLWQTVYGGGF